VDKSHLNRSYPMAAFVEPLPYGYIYAGLTIDPPEHSPFVRPSIRRDEALRRYKVLTERLETLGEVVRATLYRTVLLPPIEGAPRFDVMVLVQTTSPETITRVRVSHMFTALDADFVMPARNVRRIGDTETPQTGTFLFNHFRVEDSESAVKTWEQLTGWYTVKTGVDNSTLLQPIDASPYGFVNYVRLPRGAVQFMVNQLIRPSFHRFVRAKLRSNGMTALPLLCESV
jgi:hypothetical protein